MRRLRPPARRAPPREGRSPPTPRRPRPSRSWRRPPTGSPRARRPAHRAGRCRPPRRRRPGRADDTPRRRRAGPGRDEALEDGQGCLLIVHEAPALDHTHIHALGLQRHPWWQRLEGLRMRVGDDRHLGAAAMEGPRHLRRSHRMSVAVAGHVERNPHRAPRSRAHRWRRGKTGNRAAAARGAPAAGRSRALLDRLAITRLAYATMGSVNKVILVGNLGKDPETRYTPGGQAVANFTIATNESFTDKGGQKQERTEWHRIVCFGKLAGALQAVPLEGPPDLSRGTSADPPVGRQGRQQALHHRDRGLAGGVPGRPRRGRLHGGRRRRWLRGR